MVDEWRRTGDVISRTPISGCARGVRRGRCRLGMLMVPPSTLSLPIKVLMFVLIDGWTLVIKGLVMDYIPK